ncbi:MAG: cyanophycinase [Cytophagales bacterium]|nr:MAG: cyanophycinase [Cytophagales bacterium]
MSFKKYSIYFFILFIFLSFNLKGQSLGKLFIIGGGDRPDFLMIKMLEESNLLNGGYGIILPMASSEPDSAIYYTKKQLEKLGASIKGFDFSGDKMPTIAQLDSLKNAKLIYFTGGDQNKLMKSIKEKKIYDIIWQCYQKGGMIAGTSAGAAVMSKKMITGNEKKYKDYTQTFKTIEADNIEIGEGMGFLSRSIVDQHFLIRSRHNRLLSAVIEYPMDLCVGIDESTAILVKNNEAEVVGSSQVVVLKNQKSKKNQKNKLFAENIKLSIYIQGMKFKIK